MKRIIVFISLILVTLSSIAQVPAGMGGRAAGQNMNMGHFYGKIVDANKKGVDGATLQIKGTKFDPVTKKSAEVILGTMLSASNGDFSFENLPVMGNFKLIISAIGYKKIEKQLSFGIKMGGGQSMQEMMALVDKDLGNIKLEESPNDLQSVTVTSSAKPQFEMGIDRKIFNVDKNLTSTGQTAVEVMKSIPNLNVDIDGNVTLRNAAPTLLIDNRPTTLTMDQIPADIIDRVEIITNPSAKYDATGGNAGILNIVLKKNRKNGYNGGIRSGIDMRGRFNGGGDMNVRNNKINFSLNANLNGRKSISSSQTDRDILLSSVLPTKVFTDNQSNGQGSFNFYRGGIDYFPDNRNTFSLYGNLMQGSMGSNGTQTIDSLLGTTLKSGYQLTNSSNFDFANKGAQLSFKHLFEEKGHELSIDYNYNQADNNNWSLINSKYLNQKSAGKGNNNNNSINLDYAREFAGDVKFESGLKYSDRSEFNARDQFKMTGTTLTLLPNVSSQYRYSENLYAAYTNLNMKHNNWSYQLGLRAESRGYTGNILNNKGIDSLQFNTSYPISLFPSAFVNYKKNDKEDFQFNYSKRISPPNFFQLIPFADYTDPQNISIGNPGLKPQFTHSFEVAYNNAYKKGSNFLATAYYKYSTDLITNYVYRDINKTTGDSAYFSSSINANTATVYGLELSNKTAITKWWDLNLSFNLFKSAISATIPGQNVNNDLTSWFSKMNSTFKLPKGYSFQLSGQYQAKTILPPGGSSAEGGGRMGGRGMGFGGPQSTAQGYNLPYYDFDMAIKKDWTLSGGRTASLSLSVNDVFKTRVNKTHSESTYFIQNVSRIRDQQLFRLNFSYRFGKFDVNLLKRKTKGEDGGMMDQMPQ
jgi:outer membrane receptor protein involved in Fe transport